MAKSKSQTELIYEHLKKHGTITTMQAFELYGVTRLAARIWDLKNIYSVRISEKMETKKRLNGSHVSYAVYELKGETNG